MDREDIETVVRRVLELNLELQLRAIRQITGGPLQEPTQAPARGRRRQSLVDLSVTILTETAQPMHINHLVDLLRQRFGRVTDRDALSSALAKKARSGRLVRQVGKATFQAILPESRT